MGHGALLGHGRGEADSKELRDLLAWKVQRTKTLAPHTRAAESLCRDQKKKKLLRGTFYSQSHGYEVKSNLRWATSSFSSMRKSSSTLLA